MNTATNNEQTKAIITAPPTIRIVLQISGQAWNVYTARAALSPEE